MDISYDKDVMSLASVVEPQYMEGFTARLTNDELTLYLGDSSHRYESTTALAPPNIMVMLAPIINDMMISSDSELTDDGQVILSKSVDAGGMSYDIEMTVDGNSLTPSFVEISSEWINASIKIYDFETS